MEQKFFRCKHCGNTLVFLHHSGAPLICCGEEMPELTPNTVDASQEKHVPVVTLSGVDVMVAVGSAAHPMLEEHYIQWIYAQTDKGGQFKRLNPGEEPKAAFTLSGEKLVAVYEYCNLHGLWKKDME